MKVLLIEDEETLRNCFRLCLERAGHTVYEYNRGEGAVEYALKMRPDLVLTDHNLELRGPKGLEIAGTLKREGQRVILMSGDPTVASFAALAGVPFVEKCDVRSVVAQVAATDKDAFTSHGTETGRWNGREGAS